MVSNNGMIHTLVSQCLQYTLTEIFQEYRWRKASNIIPSLFKNRVILI